MKRRAVFFGIVLFGCSLALAALSPPLWAEPAKTQESAEKQAVSQLETMLFRLSMFHHEARSSLLSSLELPVFTDYFSLPESMADRHDGLVALKFSPAQTALRQRMEEWAVLLHRRFPIGEICLVDLHGREHMRTANGKVEPPSHFSDTEHGSPFFQPSFELPEGQVHLSTSYMSADSYRWVVAFSSPVVLADNSKPAFLHFEVPLAFYQTLITTKSTGFSSATTLDPDAGEEGRYFILDENGLLIADSQQSIDMELKAERHPEKNLKLPDYLPPERLEQYVPQISSISKAPAFLKAVQEMIEVKKGILSLELEGVSYVLAFAPIPDKPWTLAHLDPIASPGFWSRPR